MKFIYSFRLFRIIGFVICCISLSACEEFEYSPYEVRLKEDEKGVNRRNIGKIQALNISPTEPFRFILTADTQGFYEENAKMVDHINQQQGIDFVLVGGDITDFGLTKEFRLVHEDLKNLKMPYVAVIGNHDAINNGKEVFRAMYGDYDLSFTVGNSKFILLNTNHLEFKKEVPNLDWLENELKAASLGSENIFVLSHIPPKNPEFGAEKAARYSQLISEHKVSYSLHGHNHSFNHYFPFDGTVPYLETGSTETREYIIFTVTGKDIEFERVKF